MSHNYKVIEGKIVSGSVTANIIKLLEKHNKIFHEGRQINLAKGDRIVTEFVNNNKRRIWAAVAAEEKDGMIQIEAGGDCVISNGNRTKRCENMVTTVVVWNANDVPATSTESHPTHKEPSLMQEQPNVKKSAAPEERHGPVDTEEYGEHGAVYRIVYSTPDIMTAIEGADSGTWYRAAIEHIAKLGLANPGEKAVVVRVVFDDNSVGAVIDIPGRDEPQFFILNKALACLRMCGKPEHEYDITGSMSVILKTPPTIKEEEPQAGQNVSALQGHAWIPYSGQFVTLKDDPKKIAYTIQDYDQYENKFILAVADSCRRERMLRFKPESVRNDNGLILVEPSRVRPMVLFY